jgi:hypothetical protein
MRSSRTRPSSCCTHGNHDSKSHHLRPDVTHDSAYRSGGGGQEMSVDPSVSLDSGKCFSAGEGFGARLTHLHTRTQYSSVSDSRMRVKLNDEHQVPWRAPQVGRLLVFRSVQNRGSSHATSGAATDGGHWLAAMQESIASQVCPSAAAGATHALRGWQKTATPGLREAWNAQRNGFTAARTTSNDPRLPQETISISLAKDQRFARRPNWHLPYIRENRQT